MLAKTKGLVVVVCVSLCALSLVGSGSDAPPRPRSAPAPRSDQVVETVRVLTEAFVVEVNLPALAGLQVSPIGQEPHAVSVADILKCLGSGQAQVLAGAKAASQSPSPTEVQARERTYVGIETSAPPKVNYNPYESGTRFSVGASTAAETAASVRFSFSHSRFVRAARTPEAPPDTVNWEWSGSVILDWGVPQIVAATQDHEKAVFLLLTAHLQGR
jgi:hypothetical protein